MLARRLLRAGAWALGGGAFLAACSGEPMPAASPKAPTQTQAPAPSPTTTAAVEAPEPKPEPSASASADASAPPKPQSSGRPAVLKTGDTEVADTFGSSPGARLKLGDGATMKIPEGSLSQATHITFKLDPKAKSNGAQIGKIYRITPVFPPATTPVTVQSSGAPFELTLAAGDKKEANLAIGTVETDEKGREKVKWQVVSSKRIDDAAGLVYFELSSLSDSFLYVTSRASSEAKK